MKSQTPSTKLQINLKLQYQMTKTGLEFRILVIVICPSTWLRVVSLSTLLRIVSLSNGLSNHLIFEICDLEFLFIQHSSTLRPLAIFTGKTINL